MNAGILLKLITTEVHIMLMTLRGHWVTTEGI